jgi:hypothetical protein
VYLFEMRDKAIEMIEQALGKLRDSNHRSKRKSVAWGKDRQDRLKKLQAEDHKLHAKGVSPISGSRTMVNAQRHIHQVL